MGGITSIHAVRDTTPPEFHDLFFSKTNAIAGETIWLYINASDAHSGVARVTFNFRLNGFPDQNGISGEMHKNTSTNLWQFEIHINQYWSGNYEVDYDVYDRFLNKISGSSSQIVTITNSGVVDNTRPTLVSQTFDKSSASSGESFWIYVNATDDISGISSIEFYLWALGHVVIDGEMVYNPTSILWEYQAHVTDYWPTGVYEVKEIYIADYADNIGQYHLESYTPVTSIDIIATNPDTTPPDIPYTGNKYEAFLEKEVLGIDETVKLFVPITDDLSGVASARLYITPEGQTFTTVARLSLEYNSTSGYWEGSLPLEPYWDNWYAVQQITIFDMVGNRQLITDNGNHILPYFCAYDPEIDIDGDLMADGWESCYGLNPNDASDWNATTFDTDNLTPRDEYLHGTDPTVNDTDGDLLLDDQEVFWTMTNPLKTDSDKDGILDADEDADGDDLSNLDEFVTYGTHPNNTDTDGDCLLDGWEVANPAYGVLPTVWDATNTDDDNDGLNFLDEINAGTSPNNADTDSDDLSDYEEVMIYRSNPTAEDSDSDGLNDSMEILLETDVWNNDTDGDKLSDWFEYNYTLAYFDENGTAQIGTISPLDADTDGDILSDFEEIMFVGTYPFNPDSDYDSVGDYEEYELYGSSAMLNDTDSDGLSDNYEIYVSRSNPNATDTDSDGLDDYMEAFTTLTDINSNDTDGDGLSDSVEVLTNYSSPFDEDTDDDGLTDFIEMEYGSNSTNTDTDEDLMPDFWEYQYQLNSTLNDSLVDFDNDNLSTLFEYYNNTHPKHADVDLDGLNDYYELLNNTDPWVSDTDSDNISDGDEVNIYETDPTRSDTDDDGLTDYDELFDYGSDARMYDTDEDYLNDYEEIIVYFTNWAVNDSDHDNLTDYSEVFGYFTDPTSNDTDADGLNDFDELFVILTNATNPDSDDDGLKDGDEISYHTDPFNTDSDEDGLMDGAEIDYNSDPTLNDTDGDSLSDGYEVLDLGSNPTSNDTDGDTMPDWWEAIYNLKILIDDTNEDPDDDNVLNLGEYLMGTNPNEADTDLDGFEDGYEIENDTDPLDPDSYPKETLGEELMNQPLLSSAALLALIISLTAGVRGFRGGNPWKE
ncbi:MAG: hypothetical protein ACXAD7_01595 [Candidatus Kariarchaeaceae archaeon]